MKNYMDSIIHTEHCVIGALVLKSLDNNEHIRLAKEAVALLDKDILITKEAKFVVTLIKDMALDNVPIDIVTMTNRATFSRGFMFATFGTMVDYLSHCTDVVPTHQHYFAYVAALSNHKQHYETIQDLKQKANIFKGAIRVAIEEMMRGEEVDLSMFDIPEAEKYFLEGEK